jgi:prenyltransferase beta subunit
MDLLLRELERFRCASGGYSLNGADDGESVYAAFIAFLIYQDLDQIPSGTDALIRSMERFKSIDGAYANASNLEHGTTTVTSAAAILKYRLSGDSCSDLGDWLLSRMDSVSGGFFAAPGAPVADLLSTATALLALKVIGFPLNEIRMKCLQFIEDLWKPEGGFCGNLLDPVADLEYSYYGFMSLGILAES